MNDNNERILHIFQYDIKEFIPELDTVVAQGFNCIQIGPLQPMKENNPGLWWLPYQMCGLHVGNIYGTKDELKLFCQECHKRGIKVILDVVLNHTAGTNDGSLNPHKMVDDELKKNPYFWREKKEISHWEDRNDVVRHSIPGLPGLDVWNYDYQDLVAKFLNQCMDYGVDGFRFDAAKNIPLPEENIPGCNRCDFWPRVLNSLYKRNAILYGEVIYTDDRLLSMYSKYFKVLTTNEFWDKNKVVKYVESHDSYLDDSIGYSKNMSSEEIAYKYRDLARNYPNTIFYIRSKIQSYKTGANTWKCNIERDNTWKSDIVREANEQLKAKNMSR